MCGPRVSIRKGARAVAEPTEMKIGFAVTTNFMVEALTDPPVFDDGAFHAKFSPDIGVSVLRLHKFRQRSVPPAERKKSQAMVAFRFDTQQAG